ncbi:TPA: DUF551 domain-containing protein [Acinetobacter nosocomialis]
MTNLSNPETIEIHGLRTIHKLCHFGADNNMEGCTFTEIVERMFVELEKAKAQAVPETHIVVPRVPTEKFKEDLKQHLDELWWGDHGCDWDGFVSVNGIDPLKIYALAIEASESGAEG